MDTGVLTRRPSARAADPFDVRDAHIHLCGAGPAALSRCPLGVQQCGEGYDQLGACSPALTSTPHTTNPLHRHFCW